MTDVGISASWAETIPPVILERMTFSLPARQQEFLAYEAAKAQMGRSEFLRRIIDRFMEGYSKDAFAPTRKP